jgi:hypothetical protein
MIGRHGDAFDERNLFLQLGLGLVSASQRLDRVLGRYGHRVSAEPSSREDEHLVDFLLGVIAFRDHALQALEAARVAPEPAGPAREQGPALQELLR